LVIYLILAKVLGSMSPPRCAFLMGTTALFVQLPSLLTRRAQRSEVVASVVSVLGVYTLTGLDSQPLGHAEALVLGAAALSALGLVVLRLATQRSAASASALTFYSLLTVGSGAALVMLYESPAWRAASAQAWGALMYCALVAGAFTQWLQATYQKHASDGVAAMIFALKPLFAAIFSALLLGGPLEGRTYMGGSLMLLAALGPPLWAGRLPPK
ncbi:MAG: EamA family transporter, partial [Deltaproteobacteria bacterium]